VRARADPVLAILTIMAGAPRVAGGAEQIETITVTAQRREERSSAEIPWRVSST
jgi:hypothetical protein